MSLCMIDYIHNVPFVDEDMFLFVFYLFVHSLCVVVNYISRTQLT